MTLAIDPEPVICIAVSFCVANTSVYPVKNVHQFHYSDNREQREKYQHHHGKPEAAFFLLWGWLKASNVGQFAPLFGWPFSSLLPALACRRQDYCWSTESLLAAHLVYFFDGERPC